MIDAMLNRIGQVNERATVKTVFGEPYQVNGRTIIPIARVAYGFGFGGGRANGKTPAEDEGAAIRGRETGRGAAGASAVGGTDAILGSGVGGGGGAGVSVRPVAVLEMTGGETKIRPVVDVTRVVLAGMLLAAWNVFWITYTVRRTSGRR